MAQVIKWRCDYCGAEKKTDGRSLPVGWSSVTYMFVGKATELMVKKFGTQQTFEYCDLCSADIARAMTETGKEPFEGPKRKGKANGDAKG